MSRRFRELILLVALALPSIWACRPDASVPPGVDDGAEDIEDLPTADEPLGGIARDPDALPPRDPVAVPPETEPLEPTQPPATPLRPAPGGSEE